MQFTSLQQYLWHAHTHLKPTCLHFAIHILNHLFRLKLKIILKEKIKFLKEKTNRINFNKFSIIAYSNLNNIMHDTKIIMKYILK